MSAAVKLVSDNPAVLSPARTKLARALEIATKAHRRVDAARTALARASGMVEMVEANRRSFARELEQARKDRALALTSAAKGNIKPAAVHNVTKLATMLSAVDEEMSAAEVAVANCQDALDDAEERHQQARASVRDAGNAVKREEASSRLTSLFAEARVVQDRLVGLRLELAFLVKNDLISDADVEEEVDAFLFGRDRDIPGSMGKPAGRRAQGRPDASTTGATSWTFGTDWTQDDRYKVLAAPREDPMCDPDIPFSERK